MTAGFPPSTPPVSPPAPPPPAAPPKSGDRNGRLVAAVVGAVAGAVIASACWLVVSGQGGSFDSSSQKLSAPTEIGDFPKLADAKVYQADKAKGTVERTTAWNAKSSERLSASLDGAGAVVETYSDDQAENSFVLNAARATTQFPAYVPYTDPEFLRIARAQNEEKRFGNVSCVLYNQTTSSDKEAAKGSTIVVLCRRSESGLTVDITGITGDLNSDPAQVAKLVDDAWQQLA